MPHADGQRESSAQNKCWRNSHFGNASQNGNRRNASFMRRRTREGCDFQSHRIKTPPTEPASDAEGGSFTTSPHPSANRATASQIPLIRIMILPLARDDECSDRTEICGAAFEFLDTQTLGQSHWPGVQLTASQIAMVRSLQRAEAHRVFAGKPCSLRMRSIHRASQAQDSKTGRLWAAPFCSYVYCFTRR
jgi:hypothetical protein